MGIMRRGKKNSSLLLWDHLGVGLVNNVGGITGMLTRIVHDMTRNNNRLLLPTTNEGRKIGMWKIHTQDVNVVIIMIIIAIPSLLQGCNVIIIQVNIRKKMRITVQQ